MPVLQGFPVPIGVAVVPGGAPGARRPVPGLSVGDTLLNVRHVGASGTPNADITSECTISDADTVTHSTTNTTGNFLIVLWQKAT